MKYFRVKNFEKFQHYKDRSPDWIKLYGSLLDNYEFGSLPDGSKAHLVLIWLLASRKKNCLPWDERWIAIKIQAQSSVNLTELLTHNFIEEIPEQAVHPQAASISLAECKHDAILEERREEEIKGEENREESREFSSEVIELTDLLADRILQNHPTNSVKKDRARKISKWREDIERLIRLDKRTPAEIREMIEWCQVEPFWQANILSARKLREKWDTLSAQKKRIEKKGGSKDGKRTGFDKTDYNEGTW